MRTMAFVNRKQEQLCGQARQVMQMLFEIACVVLICLGMQCHALLLHNFATYLWCISAVRSCRSTGSCHRSVPHVVSLHKCTA
jgi:hypothetical protein